MHNKPFERPEAFAQTPISTGKIAVASAAQDLITVIGAGSSEQIAESSDSYSLVLKEYGIKKSDTNILTLSDVQDDSFSDRW